ncbi:ABC transporter substrate-binding protein [Paenibacillus illinoisensis]|uniref:ABC transporter substrate-binding protein n=1 Tax=Paenibacillus illinoisensis TaxID=59845 RepID=UPI001C8F0235|nr:extracellular solute-binding protein [Paenibacillus illinoisensis]MBY0217793.1 extracellular solute-binding protein [Paenibacillus illinoisensis]
MKNRLVRWLAVPAMVIMLSACSSTGSGTDESAENGINTNEVTLKVSLTAQDMNGLEALAKEYENQNPGIKIKVDRAPDNQFKQTLGAYLASKEAPDLFLQWPGVSNIGVSINAGYLTDLSDVKPVDNIDKGLLQSFSKDDKVYGIPWSKNYLGVFYNKDIFEKNGIQIPKNWDEFLEVNEKLKAAGVTPIALAGKETWAVQLPWYALAASTVYAKEEGWDQQRYDNQTTFAGSDSWKQVAGQYKQLLDLGYFEKNMLGISYDSAKTSFSAGKAAMIIDGNWSISGYEEIARKSNIGVGMFAIPGNQAGEETWLSSAPSTGLALWSGSEYQEEAKKFLAYLYADDNNKTLIGEGQFSTLKTVKAESSDITADIVDIVQNAPAYPFLDIGWPKGPQEDAFQRETQAALGGGSSFEKVLETADQAWDKGAASLKK